jgi:hypothetical protein
MSRGDFGIAGEVELAEMAALPPLPQVIADMGGPGLVGSRRSGVWVHGGKPSMRFSHVPLRRR